MKVLNENTSKTKNYLRGILALIFVTSLTAFTIYEASPFKNVTGSQIKVNGTSNIHDWVMDASSFTCEGSFVLKGGKLEDLSSLSFSLPVANLKGKENLLNTRAHKALKADQFNKITFKSTDATILPQQKTIKVNGNLTIAGTTRAVTLQANYTVNGNEITCKGTEEIKMSNFNIKAPSFMMGALKVADKVTVDFTLKLKN